MDQDLVSRAAAGDHEAFTILVDSVLDRTFTLARLIVRDDELARDIVQDTLIRAWTHLPSLRDPARFEAWLRRLLVHGCYRALRLRRGRRVLEIHVEGVDRAGADPHEALALRDELERGFRRLSPDQRAVLVLRYYLDLSEVDAAEALSIPLGTVKSRLNRATRALRAALEADARMQPFETETIA